MQDDAVDAKDKAEKESDAGDALDEFFLIGAITEDVALALMRGMYGFAKSKIRRARKPPITLNICSGGGVVSAAIEIYDAIQRLKEWGFCVNTRASGMAGSAAFMVLQAGTNRILGSYAQILIHDVAGRGLGGNYQDMLDTMHTFELSRQAMARIIADNNTAGHTDPQYWIKKYFAADNYLSATEALELGLVDEVLKAPTRVSRSSVA